MPYDFGKSTLLSVADDVAQVRAVGVILRHVHVVLAGDSMPFYYRYLCRTPSYATAKVACQQWTESTFPVFRSIWQDLATYAEQMRTIETQIAEKPASEWQPQIDSLSDLAALIELNSGKLNTLFAAIQAFSDTNKQLETELRAQAKNFGTLAGYFDWLRLTDHSLTLTNMVQLLQGQWGAVRDDLTNFGHDLVATAAAGNPLADIDLQDDINIWNDLSTRTLRSREDIETLDYFYRVGWPESDPFGIGSAWFRIANSWLGEYGGLIANPDGSIQISDYEGHDNELWKFMGLGNGNYLIINKQMGEGSALRVGSERRARPTLGESRPADGNATPLHWKLTSIPKDEAYSVRMALDTQPSVCLSAEFADKLRMDSWGGEVFQAWYLMWQAAL
ncbi:MAG: hypothetical protein KF716_26325 [Anaerolineae bacterium]|nr:hypothetical protein [Anaerolineae bacterium]